MLKFFKTICQWILVAFVLWGVAILFGPKIITGLLPDEIRVENVQVTPRLKVKIGNIRGAFSSDLADSGNYTLHNVEIGIKLSTSGLVVASQIDYATGPLGVRIDHLKIFYLARYASPTEAGKFEVNADDAAIGGSKFSSITVTGNTNFNEQEIANFALAFEIGKLDPPLTGKKQEKCKISSPRIAKYLEVFELSASLQLHCSPSGVVEYKSFRELFTRIDLFDGEMSLYDTVLHGGVNSTLADITEMSMTFRNILRIQNNSATWSIKLRHLTLGDYEISIEKITAQFSNADADIHVAAKVNAFLLREAQDLILDVPSSEISLSIPRLSNSSEKRAEAQIAILNGLKTDVSAQFDLDYDKIWQRNQSVAINFKLVTEHSHLQGKFSCLELGCQIKRDSLKYYSGKLEILLMDLINSGIVSATSLFKLLNR